jgi:hypothetical protein
MAHEAPGGQDAPNLGYLARLDEFPARDGLGRFRPVLQDAVGAFWWFVPRPARASRGRTKAETRMRRRLFLAAIAAAGAARGASARPAQHQLRDWRDPNCACCTGWVEHMRAAGFRVEDNLVTSPAPARRMLGIPSDLLSCHAATVDGYALEGHVPARAVLRLLAERPAGVPGLAVPAMPTGSPGMEVPGQEDDTYDVVAFDGGAGRRVFMRFRGGQPI